MGLSDRRRRGLTLMELIVVVICISILASIALANYTRAVEKSRSAEARNILGQIRAAELAYYMEFNAYATSLSGLDLNTVPGACNLSYYFNYAISVAGATFTASGTRCTAGGKAPDATSTYVLNITETGALGGTTGYL